MCIYLFYCGVKWDNSYKMLYNFFLFNIFVLCFGGYVYLCKFCYDKVFYRGKILGRVCLVFLLTDYWVFLFFRVINDVVTIIFVYVFLYVFVSVFMGCVFRSGIVGFKGKCV